MRHDTGPGNTGVSGESSLFGPANAAYSNFAEYAWNHNEVIGDGSGVDDTGKDWASSVAGPDSAPYWYVRHGLVDRDTSFAAQMVLYYGLRNDSFVKDANFQLAWLKPHGGNYDVQEAYAWVASVLAKAGNPAPASKRADRIDARLVKPGRFQVRSGAAVQTKDQT